MKKVFILFLLFLLVSFIADRLLGNLLLRVFTSSNCIENYAYQKCNSDVVILGSSRAKHHYVPSIISDSLGLSCFNLGENGKNVYYQYANLNLLLTHHTPKIVIYDCFSVDVIKSDFKYDWGALSDLYPVYDENESVDSLINKQGPKFVSRIKISHTYRYNSRFLEHLMAHHDTDMRGYEPLDGSYGRELSTHKENDALKIDTTKIDYMKKMIDLCRSNNIQIVFTVSPRYALNEISSPITKKYEIVRDLCQKNNVPFLYYELDITYLKDRSLFRDLGHLNDKGARQFTKQFVGDLRKVVHN